MEGGDKLKVTCPFLRYGECVIAALLRLCRDGSGRCVVVPERCMTAWRTSTGDVVAEWESCRFYMCIADCRYCQHFYKERRYCRKFNKKIPEGRELGLCCAYEGPHPPPSVKKYLEG